MDLVTGVGFARYLYVVEDGHRFSSQMAANIEGALRDAGLATGPDGEGVNWQPFRPSGALARYAATLGLLYPTLEVDWFDEPHAFGDPFLPPRGPWSRCPDCGKLVPTHGTVMTADEELVSIKECASCGAAFDAYSWERAPNRTLFSSSMVVALVADGSRSTRPSLRDGCPELVRCVEEVVGVAVREMLLRG